MEFNHCYPYNLVACLQLILRIIPTISLNQLETSTESLTRHIIEEEYPDLIQDGLIPYTRQDKIQFILTYLVSHNFAFVDLDIRLQN